MCFTCFGLYRRIFFLIGHRYVRKVVILSKSKIKTMSNVVFNGTEILLLNPDYHFKNDYDRIVMYSVQQVHDYSSSDWVSFIHPVQAFILNTFSKRQCLHEHCKELGEVFNLPTDDIMQMIKPYVKNATPIYTEYVGNKILFPKNILMPVEMLSDVCQEHYEDIPQLDCGQINLTPDRMHKGPQSLLFMLTNKCMTNCKYCYADRNTKYSPLTTDEIFKIIDEAQRLKMSYIDVIGGELFCRKDWFAILKKLVGSNLTPNYISTKCPISEEQIKMLRDTGYDNVIQISLDSLDDKVLSYLIGSKEGYAEKMKQTIELLQKYEFKIQIDTILTKYNSGFCSILKLFNYIKHIKNLVYWEIRIPEVSIYTPNEFKEIKAERADLGRVREFVNNNLKKQARFQIIFSDEALQDKFQKGKPSDDYFVGGTCGFLKNRMFVLPDGKVSACEQLYWHPQFIIGDLRKQSLCEVWNSDKALSLFQLNKDLFRNSACFDCKAIDLCNKKHHRCFVKVIKAYGKDNWNYPDPRCIYAPKTTSDLVY